MGIIGKLRARAAADAEVAPVGALLVSVGLLLVQIGTQIVQRRAKELADEVAEMVRTAELVRPAPLEQDGDEAGLAAVPDA